MASRKPTADEATQTEGRALPAPKEESARGKKLRPSGQHHLVAEVTASGAGLALREADAKVRPHARHDVPSEVTAGRGVVLTSGASDEVTTKGVAVREAQGQDEPRPRARHASSPPGAGRSSDGGRARSTGPGKEGASSRARRAVDPPGGSWNDEVDPLDSPSSAGKGADPSSGSRNDEVDPLESPSSPARKDADPSGRSRSDETDQLDSTGRRAGEASNRSQVELERSRGSRSDEVVPLGPPSSPGRKEADPPGGSRSDEVDSSGRSEDEAPSRARSGRSDSPGQRDDAASPDGGLDDRGALAAAEDALDAFDDEPPGAPPEAEAVASRALAVAALVQRGFHEARPNNASDVRQLQSWVDAFGLFAGFGAGAIELFDAKHGAWTPEDRTAVAWLGEELRLLLWALTLEPALPSTFERSDARALVQRVPLLEPPQAFVAKAQVRDLDELEVMRAFYEVLFEAARAELWARAVLEDPSLLEAGDEELDAFLEVIATDGTDAVATLRTFSRTLLTELFAPGSPHAALAFDPGALEAMSDVALANAFAIARTRSGALEWLTEGEAWDFDDDEDGVDDEG